MKIGDYILRIAHTSQFAHLLCWIHSKDFYGRLCWRYVGRSDMNYNIMIENNKKRAIDSEKEEEILVVKDLKQISFRIMKVGCNDESIGDG
jgi:hypothetical protein